MRNKLAAIAIAIVALTVISCNTAKKANDNTMQDSATKITNSTWELVKLGGTNIDQANTDGKKIQFSLNSVDQRAFGYSGCNTFNGSYTLEKGNRISFSQMASTSMACPDTEISEQEVLNAFNLADNYTINNGMLSLNVGKRAPLAVFKKVSSQEKIVEKYWKLKKMEGQNIVMAKNQEREIYFMLKNDQNRITGFAGCNNLSGTYTLEEGNRINFSNIAVTLKACPDVAINETEFLKVFELADNYTINGDTLMLNVGKRVPLAVFEAVYF